MRRSMKAAAFAGALALAACHPRSATRELPALISNPTPEGHTELTRVVSRALNGTSVMIADDALTRDSTLIIERTPRRDAQGLPLNGRGTGRPERFQLVKSGSRCLLVHERTGKRWRLAATTCTPR